MAKQKNTTSEVQNDLQNYNKTISPELESEIRKAMGSASAEEKIPVFGGLVDNATEIAKLAGSSTAVKDKQSIQDHYGNSLASIGNQDRVQTFTNYGFSADTLNWPLWLALYNDSWVFRRAIDKPAQDEVLAGFTLHGNRDYSRIYKIYNRYKNDLTELLTWGALFGGSVAVMMFDGIKPEDLARPIDKEKIKNKRFKLYVVDRWYGVEQTVDDLVKNMKDIDYGKPKYYTITMADGSSRRVHHSWVLRYEHRTAPRLIKNGQLQGWGYSEGSHIINELARDDQLKTSITSLVNKSLIEVVKMSGMRGVFMGTDQGNETQLRKRLEMVTWGRTYNSLTFLDKEDEYEHFELTGLSGLADLMEKNMWLIAAALEMQGVLFGDLKGGLSQESDAYSRYCKTIKRRCDSYFRNVLQKFLTILFISCDFQVGKDKHGKIKYESPDFDFDSLDKAEENKAKMESIKTLSDLLSKLNEDGIVSKYQYAKTIKNYINDDVINLDISDEVLNSLKLVEEQAIIDTIKEVGKKRDKSVNYNEDGTVDLNHPFGTPGLGHTPSVGGTEIMEEDDDTEIEEPSGNETEMMRENESNPEEQGETNE